MWPEQRAFVKIFPVCRVLWYFLSHRKYRIEKTINNIRQKVKGKCTQNTNHQGGPTPPLHSYVNYAISKCYKHPQRTIWAGRPRPYVRTLTPLYPNVINTEMPCIAIVIQRKNSSVKNRDWAGQPRTLHSYVNRAVPNVINT